MMQPNTSRHAVPLLLAMFALSAFILFPAGGAAAQAEGFGVGVIAGEPTGISLKCWLLNQAALDGAIGWSFVDDTEVHLHLDYVRHTGLVEMANEPMHLYYGVGGRLKYGPVNVFGLRLVGGMDYFFPNSPMDAFIEVAPILDVAPETDVKLNASVGLRWFFPDGFIL